MNFVRLLKNVDLLIKLIPISCITMRVQTKYIKCIQ